MFLSDASLSCSKTFQFLTGSLIEQQLNEIAAIGTGFDIFRLEDLPELVRGKRLKQYRFAIVLNAHVLDDGLRDLVEYELKKDGRTILWFHAPGIVRNGRFDVEGCNALTGIHCVMSEGQRSSLITEVLIDGQRFSYGTPRNINPRLCGADPAGKALGWIVEGSWIPFRKGANGAMLIEKERAGVHLYSSRGDQVFPSKNWIAVHCKWDDVLELRLPEPGTWRDAFTNEILIENSDRLRLKTHRGKNVVLERVDPRPNPENGK